MSDNFTALLGLAPPQPPPPEAINWGVLPPVFIFTMVLGLVLIVWGIITYIKKRRLLKNVRVK